MSDDKTESDTDETGGDPPTAEEVALAALVGDLVKDPAAFDGEPGLTSAGAGRGPDSDDDDRPLSLEEIDLLAPIGRIVVRKREPGDAAEAPPSGTGTSPTGEGPPSRAAEPSSATETGEGLAVLADAAVAPPRSPRRSPSARQRTWRDETSPWWRWGYPAALLVAVLLVPLLVWVGYRTVLESNDSNAVRTDKAESDPGWEALVEPTRTMAVGFTDADGKLAAVSVLSLSGESAGGIVTMHPSTVGPVPGTDRNTVPEVAYAEGGAQGMSDMVAAMLNTGMGDVAILDQAQLASLLAPVGSLTFDNGDVVTTPDTKFSRGELTLDPADAAAYLNTRNQVTDDLNRLDRYNWFWEAWLAAIAAHGDDGAAVPGETDSGLGMFLTELAGGQVQITTLPVQASALPGATGNEKVYVPMHPETEQLMVTVVPFPVGAPPGARVRIRLLDGTGQLNHGLPASPLLVYQGGEISVIGNAATFDNPTTKVIYYDDAMLSSANAMRDALGVGTVEKSDALGEPVDLTIVLGSDWAALPVAQQQIPLTQGTATVVGTSVKEVPGG